MQVTRVRRGEFQDTNEVILVVEGCHHQVTHTVLENFLLNSRVMGVGSQVFDQQEFPLRNGLFVERTGKVRDAILRRIGAESAMRHMRSGIEHEDALSLEGG